MCCDTHESINKVYFPPRGLLARAERRLETFLQVLWYPPGATGAHSIPKGFVEEVFLAEFGGSRTAGASRNCARPGGGCRTLS